MTDWRPSSGPDAARRRAALLERVRQFFADRGVLAIDTPALAQDAVSDPQIESISVRSGCSGEHFLNPSPEFCMKRLLAAGYPDIYAICRVFRGGEAGKRHQPEFTMVEWYRLGFGLDSIVAETVQLLTQALDDPKLATTAEQLDYAAAFRRHANIDVFNAGIDELAACAGADIDLRAAIANDQDAWHNLIFSAVVTPQFAPGKLTVVRHYPASQAALSRICPIDNRVADRFEIFYGANELANGYVELTDADEQMQRINTDQEKRRLSGRPVAAYDKHLIAALEAGLPECAGVAVGLERVQMAHDKTGDIGNVVTFTFEEHHD